MRVRMSRRSVSSWLSPGPRVPIPPPVRDRCVHNRVNRGQPCVAEIFDADVVLGMAGVGDPPGDRIEFDAEEPHPLWGQGEEVATATPRFEYQSGVGDAQTGQRRVDRRIGRTAFWMRRARRIGRVARTLGPRIG